MFMLFEIVSICLCLWYFFQKHVVLQLIQIYINNLNLNFEIVKVIIIYIPLQGM